MELEKWARQLINDHKNPLVKFELDKSKFYLPTNTQQETTTLNKKLETLRNILNSNRVDRRCSRCKGNWIPVENVTNLTNIVGSKFHHMGYQNKTGRFIFPKETLFLLETNRCEILWNSISIPISQAYEILLNGFKSLYKYTVYRSLSLKGFDVQRVKKLMKEEDSVEPPVKKMKIEEEVHNEFDEIFKRLQGNGPRSNEVLVEKVAEYKVEVGVNKEEFSFHFLFDEELDPKIGFYTETNNNVFCTFNNDSPIFTRFSKTKLPYLTYTEKIL